MAGRYTQFHVSEVEPTSSVSPISTFDVRGKAFYVDVDSFSDKELLLKLSPGIDREEGKPAAADVGEEAVAKTASPS